MDEQRAVSQRLVTLASRYLLAGDREGLAAALKAGWSTDCLRLLLTDPDEHVRQTAVFCLGLIGEMADCSTVAGALHDESDEIASIAEDALWSIWFRQGGDVARLALLKIADSIDTQDTENAIPLLNDLIRYLPTYAEAYHQRSQVHYLENNLAAAHRDAVRAQGLNPLHFSALAIQAHSLAGLGRLAEALNAYKEVLKLHPRLPGVRAAIHTIRKRINPIQDSADRPALA